MAQLVRLGDLMSPRISSGTGEHKPLAGSDNLAMKVFFPDLAQDASAYVHHAPKLERDVPGLPEGTKLGDYEAMLFGKMLKPTLPVICIEGAIGSGKSTTIDYLLKHVLANHTMPASSTASGGLANRLVAQIDFNYYGPPPGKTASDQESLIGFLCQQLRAHATRFVRDAEECSLFWQQTIAEFDEGLDRSVTPVASALLNEAPWLRDEMDRRDRAALRRRIEVRETLRRSNLRWYLGYLSLLWRYLRKTRFADQPESALVVLDNVDSLAADLQRYLFDFVMRSNHKEGPTFVLLMRPETRMRQGLGDLVADVVKHEGPQPWDIVIDRMERLCREPDRYLTPESGLAPEQRDLMERFVIRVRERMLSDSVFERFIGDASGESVRIALILAQSVFLLDAADMQREEITTHFLVRACVTQGGRQFRASEKNALMNLFDVSGADDGRFLIKPRILHFFNNHGGPRVP